jgi:muramoyltetrapeptide carboxypeptidase
MNRRDLLKAAATLPLVSLPLQSQSAPTPARAPELIKPPRLAPGDTIAVIAPASGLKPDSFDRALQKLESLGFKTKVGRNARGNRGLFSGTEAERLADLHWAFGDPEVRGIWCVRGGDGAPRILPDLDYALIRKNPKVFIGYSDITALHLAISQNTGLVTFHGPVGSSSFSDYARDHVLNVLTRPTAPYVNALSADHRAKDSALFKTEVVTPGRARGRLTGGNLSLVTALAGTPWALRGPAGKILFLEDIDEQPYRVDRMLTQLRQSVDLRALAGIALGVFEGCVAKEDKPQPTLIEVVRERLGDLGIPVIYGLSFGHVRDQFTLPMGIAAELDTAAATVTFLETAVT